MMPGDTGAQEGFRIVLAISTRGSGTKRPKDTHLTTENCTEGMWTQDRVWVVPREGPG